jgi:ABC-2 type transport system ATP-binding protein
VAAGPLADIAGTAPAVLVESPDAEALAGVLARDGAVRRVEPAGPGRLRVHGLGAARVADLAAAHRVRVHGLAAEEPDLERLFFELTGGA